MRLPITFSRYIGRQFLISVLVALGIVLAIIGVIELVEMIRRASNKEYIVPFSIILEMTLLKIPYTAEKVLPYGVLIGGMVALVRLTRSYELIVTRSAGISVWQFLLPAVAVSMCLGVFFMTVFNPIAASMISRYEVLEGKYIAGRPSVLSVSPSGLWIRQVEDGATEINGNPVEEYIIHSTRIAQSDMTLYEVIIFTYGPEHKFVGRIDADSAQLAPGQWHVYDAMISVPGRATQHTDYFSLKTELSVNQIQESFASPKTLSFWELPGFIGTLEKAGFSALRHKLHWHTVLSSPIMLSAMVLIAAVFSLRMPRRGKIGIMIVAGVITGFLVNFFSELVYALGLSGNLPVVLAAWTPATITLMVSMALLLHLEDG